MERAMIDWADVVVIGSGGLGAATAFHLARRGAGRVALLDRHALASQTSPRAAGLVSHARSSDVMVRLVTRAAEQLKGFSDATGHPLDWVQSGSLKVARRSGDVTVLELEVARGRSRWRPARGRSTGRRRPTSLRARRRAAGTDAAGAPPPAR